MERLRKPGQGVGNIVRFNWHFYVLALALLGGLASLRAGAGPALRPYVDALLLLVAGPTLVSLLVSAYVYDTSNLYALDWLPDLPAAAPDPAAAPAAAVPDPAAAATAPHPAAAAALAAAAEAGPARLVNINAGFDETSALLAHRFPGAGLTVLDFYDPAVHTEVSIRRARAAYPPYPGTRRVAAGQLPLPAGSCQRVFLFMAAHEARQPAQRVALLREVGRLLLPGGQAVVVEHLRDLPNFLAYTVGFLHFYSGREWRRVFRAAGLVVAREQKITPFVSAFTLVRDGNPR